MKQNLKIALIAVAAVILVNAVASFLGPVKSALNSIPGNENTWG